MMENGIVMEDVYIALMDYDIDKLNFVYSDDNSKELVGRLSINAEMYGKKDELLNGLADQSDILSIFQNIQGGILSLMKLFTQMMKLKYLMERKLLYLQNH